MSLKGDQHTTRALNRRLILNLLRRQKSMSRVDIAAQTGLSSAAVTFVTTDLLSEKLIIEGEAARGGGGRRPVPLSINFRSKLAIGIKLSATGLQASLCDLSTAALVTITEPIPDTRPETVVHHAAKIVRWLMADPLVGRAKVIGVGLALPGSYDVERGVCTFMARFGWVDVPIADMLAQVIDLPVWVDNDVNAFALAQHLFGRGQNYRNMMVFVMGTGIAAAFMTEGLLHRGARGAAGEIGHLNVVPHGRTCVCGRRGCLETYWSDSALRSDWAAYVAQNSAAEPDLALAADQGDVGALDLLSQAGFGVGTALAAAAGLIDPDLIVIGGKGARYGKHLRDPIQSRMDELAYKSRPQIILEWGVDSWPRCAAALVIQKFFDFEVREGIRKDQ